MLSTEMFDRESYINKMYKDVFDSVEYDELSAKEYGEDRVDSHLTAINLYDKGYKNEIDVIERILIELSLVNINGGYEEDMLDDFYTYISRLEQRLIKMKEEHNMKVDTLTVKITSAAIRCKHLHNPKMKPIIATGFDHDSCYTELQCRYGYNCRGCPEQFVLEEGFLTTKGEFVDRLEAMKIAKEADQLDWVYKRTDAVALKSYMLNYRVV